MKIEKQPQEYITSKTKRSFEEMLTKTINEIQKLPVIDTSMLMVLQISLEEENKFSRELIEHEEAMIKRRSYSIKELQKILGTSDFIKSS